MKLSPSSSHCHKVSTLTQALGRPTVLTMIALAASVATAACSSSSTGSPGGESPRPDASGSPKAPGGNPTSDASSKTAPSSDAAKGPGDAGPGSDAGSCSSASCADGGSFYTAAAFFRGPLAASVSSSETTSNMFFTGVEAEAKGAGDDGHQALLGTTDLGTIQNQFVGLDTWISDAEMNAVYSAPPVLAFGMSFYSAPPEFETFYLTDFYQWGNTHSATSSSPFYVVVVRGLYKSPPAAIKPAHDSIAQGAEADYKAAGNVAHIVWSGRTNPLEALIVDVWTSDANIGSFYGTSFQTSLATLFDATGPNYGVYGSTDWVTW